MRVSKGGEKKEEKTGDKHSKVHLVNLKGEDGITYREIGKKEKGGG